MRRDIIISVGVCGPLINLIIGTAERARINKDQADLITKMTVDLSEAARKSRPRHAGIPSVLSGECVADFLSYFVGH